MFCLNLNIAAAGLALSPPRSLTDWWSLWEKSHKRRKFYFGAAQSVGFVQNPGTRWEASKDGEKAGWWQCKVTAISGRSWISEKFAYDWRNANADCTCMQEGQSRLTGELQSGQSAHLRPRENHRANLLEALPKCTKDKKVMGSSLHLFAKGRLIHFWRLIHLHHQTSAIRCQFQWMKFTPPTFLNSHPHMYSYSF